MAPLRQRRYDMFGLVFPSVTFGEVKALDQSHTAWKLRWETQKKKILLHSSITYISLF